MSLLRQVNAWLFDSLGTGLVLSKGGHIKVLNEVQDAVHDGMAFSFSGNGIGLANNATITMLLRTGTRQVHFDGLSFDTSAAPVSILLYESPTVTATGTAQSVRRRNRNNANTPLSAVYLSPTVSANGTLIDTQLIVAQSQGGNKVAGTGDIDGGWVFKASTDYYMIITNSSGGSINYNFQFTFHEATYNV